eukprot:TRINITY_DN6573_c0_g1_i3.p1 TRINITY_DN6573_c0_g1~~TRINITY_DN6573_c0_g1_i3.p1  ORF type:complete len:424 (-),score=177.54 TRINITY_DN6573_c0_g1_i3:760-2031(-)
MNESPELLDLLEEFKTSLVQVRDRIQPILDKVRAGQLPTSNGMSYLEVKFHLLLSYCINISFYMMLKAEGKSVKDHPVIDQLVRYRTILEKMRPLDQKLKYQVDKLLKLALEPEGAEAPSDLRSHKPDLGAFLTAAAEETSSKSGAAKLESSELYRVTRNVEHHFEEKTAADRRKKKDQIARRMHKSKLMQDIRETYGDEPIEQAQIGAGREIMDADDLERQQFEEDNYMRTMLSKADKKKQRAKKKFTNEMEELLDIGHSGLFDRAAELDEAAQREDERRRKAKIASLADLSKAAGKAKPSGDADVPRRDREREQQLSQRRQKHAEADDEDDGLFDFGGARVPSKKANGKANGKRPAEDDDDTHDAVEGRQEEATRQEEVYQRNGGAAGHRPLGPVRPCRRARRGRPARGRTPPQGQDRLPR